ncbi:MAG: hypothetical protein O7C75_03925, partial [Verrucomicrobia bacterium]|nr:hypothetical protein [Verrucomicrobiota bacterium]
LFVLFTIVAFLLAIPASHFILGKAHVPSNKVQVCHKGEVITVGAAALDGHLGHNDFQIPACDSELVRMTGNSCTDLTDTNGDGKADQANNPVDGTPGCPSGAGIF